MWLRRPMEGSVGASEGAEPEGEVSREAFPMVGQHVNPRDNHDVNYNHDSTSNNIIAQQGTSAHVCPTHHHQAAPAAAAVATAGYAQQPCSALQPPGHPGAIGPPGTILDTGGGENAATPSADDSLRLHISYPPFPLGNPDGNGDVWHATFPGASPHPQGPHQHHQPLQHHIPVMSAAGGMCVSSPVGEQIHPSPPMECGLPAGVGFAGSCCGIRVEEVQQAGGVAGPDVGHGQGGAGGGGTMMENGGVAPGQVVAAVMPGKEGAVRVHARRGKVLVDDGTPESIGMHKLMEHKHWAAVYIKPNSVYKRRAFSSLKQRKRRDLVAVGFNVFHKICDSISSGEPELFMAAVLNSSHVHKMTKRLRRADGDPNGSPTQQPEEQQPEKQQEQQEQQQQQQQQQQQPREQQAVDFNVHPAVAHGAHHVTAAVVALTSDRGIEQSYHQHHHPHHHHQHHQQHQHHQDNGHSNAGHDVALALNPPQVAATGIPSHHPPLDHPPVGMADVRAYEQATFLTARAAPASAGATAAAATAAVSNAAAANAAAASAAAANAAAIAAIATATNATATNATAAASAAAATAAVTATTVSPAVSCPSDGGIGGGIGDNIRDSIGNSINAGGICFSAAGADSPTVGRAGFTLTIGDDERGVAGNPDGETGGGQGAAIGTPPPPPLQYSPFLPSSEHLAENGTAAGGRGSIDAINAEEVGAAERGGVVVAMGVNVGKMKEAAPEPEPRVGSAAVAAAEAVGATGRGEGEGVVDSIFPATTCPDRCTEEVVGVAAVAAAAAPAVETRTGGEEAVGVLFPATACANRCAGGVVGVAAVEAVATGGEGAEALFPATACPMRCAEEPCTDRGRDAGSRIEGVRCGSAGDVGEGGGVAACEMVIDGQGVGVEEGQCVVLSGACCPAEGGLVVSGQKRPRLELTEVHEGHEMVGGAGALVTEHSSSGISSIDDEFPGVEEGDGVQGIFESVPCESTNLPDVDIREN